jgi:mono/diheme cytochrome c family protein
MKQMLLLCAAVVVVMVAMLLGQQPVHSAPAAVVARGKYLVEDIGACGDCHTPMNEKGEPIKEQWLKGTTLMFKPTVPVPNWADKSANIAGLPGWSDEAAIKFFMTGIAYNGLPARPPMPQYRYSRQDAAAIVAYLKSVGSK